MFWSVTSNGKKKKNGKDSKQKIKRRIIRYEKGEEYMLIQNGQTIRCIQLF